MASDNINKEYILKYCIIGETSLKEAIHLLHISPARMQKYIDQIIVDHSLPPAPMGTKRLAYVRKDIRSLCGMTDDESLLRNTIFMANSFVPIDDQLDREKSAIGVVESCPTLDELDRRIK